MSGEGNARAQAATGRLNAVSFAENALDLADSSAVDLGDLGNRHAVLHQGVDTPELRPRNLAHPLRLGLGEVLRSSDGAAAARVSAARVVWGSAGRSASAIPELLAS